MQDPRRPRINFVKSLQPTPEAGMGRLARLRRQQRLLLHDRRRKKNQQFVFPGSPGSFSI